MRSTIDAAATIAPTAVVVVVVVVVVVAASVGTILLLSRGDAKGRRCCNVFSMQVLSVHKIDVVVVGMTVHTFIADGAATIADGFMATIFGTEEEVVDRAAPLRSGSWEFICWTTFPASVETLREFAASIKFLVECSMPSSWKIELKLPELIAASRSIPHCTLDN